MRTEGAYGSESVRAVELRDEVVFAQIERALGVAGGRHRLEELLDQLLVPTQHTFEEETPQAALLQILRSEHKRTAQSIRFHSILMKCKSSIILSVILILVQCKFSKILSVFKHK